MLRRLRRKARLQLVILTLSCLLWVRQNEASGIPQIEAVTDRRRVLSVGNADCILISLGFKVVRTENVAAVIFEVDAILRHHGAPYPRKPQCAGWPPESFDLGQNRGQPAVGRGHASIRTVWQAG